jgi:hypothetical protein
VPATAARSLAERADSRPLRAARNLAPLTPEERHRLRLRVKAARYAVELLAPLLPRKRALYVPRTRLQTRSASRRHGARAPSGARRASIRRRISAGYGAGRG